MGIGVRGMVQNQNKSCIVLLHIKKYCILGGKNMAMIKCPECGKDIYISSTREKNKVNRWQIIRGKAT